jgi:hypothetical protein
MHIEKALPDDLGGAYFFVCTNGGWYVNSLGIIPESICKQTFWEIRSLEVGMQKKFTHHVVIYEPYKHFLVTYIYFHIEKTLI